MATYFQNPVGAVLVLGVVFAWPTAFGQSVSDAGGGVQASAKESPQDRAIAEEVCDKLKADSMNYYTHVTVSVEKGVVTLGGSVGSTEALTKAKKIAASVAGVTTVRDQMQVTAAPSRTSGS